MNKDEMVLASTTANGMREITQERASQAMQEQAIAFAEWIVSERWKIEFKEQRHFTTAKLYTLFNTNNTNNALKAENTLLKEVNEAQIFTIEKYQEENESLTTQLAKANSDKEKLGGCLKIRLDELTEVIEFNRNGNCEEILLLQLSEAKKIQNLLTDCGITL